MVDFTRPRAIETLLAEVDAMLRAAPASPASRELRVRYGSLARVVTLWMHATPHEAQVGALLECVVELHGAVSRLCPPAARTSLDGSRPTAPRPLNVMTTRPPPRRPAAQMTTRPPPRRA